MIKKSERIGASFRDPSGFIFIRNDQLYRQINFSYKESYDLLISSGLYDELTRKGWLVNHEEVSERSENEEIGYKVIKPTAIPFISYPYEWSFSQLKDAALLTLDIAKSSLERGMILKDASAFNIQFMHSKPVLIDTLSFDIYREGSPWDAYRQFCQHFLAPLALAAKVDIRFIQLLRVYMDGIPLDLASKILPGSTRVGLSGLALHIHLHARMQQQYAAKEVQTSTIHLGMASLIGILEGLRKTIASLNWEPKGTEWGNYYNATNYSSDSHKQKGEIVGKWIEEIQPKMVWDLGANNGLFSRESSQRGVMTIASDIDPVAVEKDYLACKNRNEKYLLPLVIDLTNPSSAIGWENKERDSFIQRGPVDVAMALALIHHLAISSNVPLESIADFFATISEWVIIEFIPKSDSQVKRLLATRKDIFPQYSEEGFETAMAFRFKLIQKQFIPGSDRKLYLFKKN